VDVKVTYFFEDVTSAHQYTSAALGWTETFYGVGGGTAKTATLDAWLAHTAVNDYVTARLLTMPATYRLAWIRVSDEANPRSFKVKALKAKFGQAIRQYKVPGASTLLDIPIGQVQCALLVDLIKLPTTPADHSHHRRFLMRGLPSDVINGNVVETLGPNWSNILAFLNWIAFKDTGGAPPGLNPAIPPGTFPNDALGLRFQNPANLAYQPSPGVTNTTGDARSVVISTTLNGTVGVTDYVLRDFPDNVRALNRTWRLLYSSALPAPTGSSILGKTRRDMPSVNYVSPGTGKFRQVIPAYGLFDQYFIVGLRTKRTGRLFRQLRGRSANR